MAIILMGIFLKCFKIHFPYCTVHRGSEPHPHQLVGLAPPAAANSFDAFCTLL